MNCKPSELAKSAKQFRGIPSGHIRSVMIYLLCRWANGGTMLEIPVNLTLPVITGTPQEGETLTGTNGTWSNFPTSYTYRWLADGVEITGETTSALLLTAAQVGAVITFEVTAINAEGTSVPATSAATSAVLPAAPAGVTNLTAIYASNSATEIDLAWTDNATNETEYRIYRSNNGAAYILLDTIAAGSVSYADTTVTSSHLWEYKVAPANSGGETLSVSVTPTVASFIVTTTGAQTLTIAALTVSAAMTVDWGDGNTDSYSGAGARTHNYAGAATVTVRLLRPLLVTVLNLSDNKITLNSNEIKPIVNVTDFRATALKAGRFDSVDVTAWRPNIFYLYSLLAGCVGTFSSTDISGWRPLYFDLHSMPNGYTGTFNSADISGWTLRYFIMYSMPSGYSGNFNSVDISGLNLLSFSLYSMPTATFTLTISAGGFAGWTAATTVNLNTMNLGQTAIDQILSDLYTAFATRTVTGGTITLNGTGNAAPIGTYQAMCPPTTGKEYRYELLNDSCGVNPTKKWATITTN